MTPTVDDDRSSCATSRHAMHVSRSWWPTMMSLVSGFFIQVKRERVILIDRATKRKKDTFCFVFVPVFFFFLWVWAICIGIFWKQNRDMCTISTELHTNFHDLAYPAIASKYVCTYACATKTLNRTEYKRSENFCSWLFSRIFFTPALDKTVLWGGGENLGVKKKNPKIVLPGPHGLCRMSFFRFEKPVTQE